MTDGSQRKQKTRSQRSCSGVVRSLSGDKTLNVIVENLVKHQRYGKYIRRRTKLAVHDPKSIASVGDTVEIVPCRPISKTKSWRLVRVVRPSNAPAPAGAEKG